MEKQVKSNRCVILAVLLLVISICVSFTGCTVNPDVSGPTGESVAIGIPNTTSEDQNLEETHSVTVPDKSESTLPETETVPAETTHVHSYSSKVTAPSCTLGGYNTFTCGCGDTYAADHTSAVGHSYSEKITVATCTEMGYTTYTCSVCGNSYTENKTNATGHNWGSWTVIKESTATADGREQRICKTCNKTESRSIEKLVYESFTGSIGNYNAHNLAYTDWKGDTEQAAFIEVYTIGKRDKALSDLAAQFEKVYGFAPSLGDKYRCTTSCNKLGTYMVEGYSEPQTVYHYTITDKTYIYITNEMYKVYVQRCADGSVWVGYCIYGTMDTLGTERNKANVKALDKEMYTTFEELIGLSRSEMNAYKEQLELKIGYISEAGTVRSVHSDTPVQVLYIYCRGFAYSDNNS
ncbi:MAG: hypothetical protein J6A88_07205 [Oscillospiraceae bacterium]|nr:hypothetical protein [Oscillospiraceae bacterium]